MWTWLLSPGTPVWAEICGVFGSACLAGVIVYPFAYRSGARWRRDKVREEIEAGILKRRNDLLQRGRTTERRPEHDDQTPSRVGRIKIVNRRPNLPGQPPDQL